MISESSASRRKQVQDRLNALRNARLGNSRNNSTNEPNNDLYDEVDENDYLALQNDESFVEDDDNAGYIDRGYDDEMDEGHYDDYEDDEKAPNKRKRKTDGKTAKAVKKPNTTIETLFQRKAARNLSSKPSKRVTEPKESNQAEEEFMSSLLADLDVSQNEKPTKRHNQRVAPYSRPAPKSIAAPLRDQDLSVDIMDDVDVKPVQDDNTLGAITPPLNLDAEPVKQDKAVAKVHTMDVVTEPVKEEREEPKMQTTSNITEEPADWEAKDLSLGNMDNIMAEPSRWEAQGANIHEEDGSVQFWWYDAYERREKGQVYLFGKIFDKNAKRFVSCCVSVKNIERNVFVLPRQYHLDAAGEETDKPVTMNDVHAEISEVFMRYKIRKWASKATVRKYAFEIAGIPEEAEYLKILYDYEQPQLPANLNGTTFGHVFGSNTGPLEHFLIKRDIMGPCWLKVEKAKISNLSETWCKIEITVDNPKTVNVLRQADGNLPTHVPPLTVMSLSLRTLMNQEQKVNEIVSASFFVCTQVDLNEAVPIEEQPKTRFSIVRPLNFTPYPAGFKDALEKEKRTSGLVVQMERNETALLSCLIAKIHLADPDIIVGHNFTGFDLDVLLHRMKACNTSHWHKLGRLKRKNWPKLQVGAGGSGESTYQERVIMSGRLICDTYLAAKDHIRSKSYRLTDLAESQLKITREDIAFEKIPTYFQDAKSLLHLIKHNAFDTYLTTALMFKLQILPLTKQLTNLAGNLWSRTLTGARAERNEYLLLHEFHRQKYICPDKLFNKIAPSTLESLELDEDAGGPPTKSSKSGRRKPAYAGGLVLEPKKGFYDKYVLLLDFNSLYPSIIQEYNVCFTTIQREKSLQNSENTAETEMPSIPDKSVSRGLLPRIIKTLVDRRQQVKSLMKDPKLTESERIQYDIRQKGLKLTANSMYGCLGFSHSRFYAKPLAMLITYKGREILQDTVELAESMGLNVIYGDTDSIMVYTGTTDIAKVKEIGYKLKRSVNERYKLLEIDIDGLFKHMLLLKKKKYAALLVEQKADGTLVESVETKGLDMVRRDWCDLSHDVSSLVLDSILSSKMRDEVVEEIHTILRRVADDVRTGKVSLDKYVINKQLTKALEEYSDPKSQPHVQVALRMRASGVSVKPGDTIPFVICKVDDAPIGGKSGFAERAYHPDDVKQGKVELDIDWYLNQQVHPPIARLCSPIEGTDAAMLAECLGLDGSKFNVVSRMGDEDAEEFTTLESQIPDEERFKNSEKLSVKCHYCKEINDIDGATRQSSDGKMVSSLQCSKCSKLISRNVIRMYLIDACRRHIARYYEGWMVCDDTICGNRTRSLSVMGPRCLKPQCLGSMRREYSDKQLYTQLLFFSKMFDIAQLKKKVADSPDRFALESAVNKYQDLYEMLYKTAEQYLNRSAYRYVDLEKLFSTSGV